MERRFMACVNCGKTTERNVHICQQCTEEARSLNLIGASLAMGPSTMNVLSTARFALLPLDGQPDHDYAGLMGVASLQKPESEKIDLHLDDIARDDFERLVTSMERMLLNMGLPLDLSAKKPPLLTEGDLGAAENVLRRVSDIEKQLPHLPGIRLNMLVGSLYFTLSNPACGAVTITDSKHYLSQAVKYYDTALKKDNKLVVAWKNKAKVLIERGECQEAVSCLDWITSNLELPADDVSIALNKGMALYELGRLEEASSHLDTVLDEDAQNVEAWRIKGNIYGKMNRWGGAIQCYNEAVKHDPSREDVWIAIAEIYINHGKYKEASKALDQVLKTNIWNTDAWYFQGIVFSKIGRWGAAIQCLDKALSIEPTQMKIWKAKGELLSGSNRNDEALACIDSALRIAPSDTEMLRSKLSILKSMNRFNDALALMDGILEVDPGNADAWYEKGRILADTGKVYKALKSLDCAIEQDPGFMMAHYEKGQTLEKLRRFKDALACYEKAISLDPKFERALRAKNDVKKKIEKKKK
jgi:tetratricopeptide (TPR) repeat protein